MSFLQHGQVTDSELYLEDKSLIGIAQEFDINELEHKTIEHETLGSVVIFAAPGRGVQKLSGKLTLLFPEKEIAKRVVNPTVAVPFQLHQPVDVFDEDGLNTEDSHFLVTHVKAMFGKIKWGKAKKGDLQTVEADFTTNYLMQRVLGEEQPLFRISAKANRFQIDGQDVWPR